MKGNKTASATNSDFEAGPQILPKTELLKFLEGQEKKSQLLKIPVVIRFGEGFPRSITEAFIAVDENLPEKKRVQLMLDDGGMGISLDMHLRDLCPKGDLCKLWLTGSWGALLDMDILGDSPNVNRKLWPFALRGVDKKGPESVSSNEDARIWLEK